ncbi:hypothetical protein B0H16DRAFT_1455402 [Mycena metata]|uniref:Uncharacterized protein n=1 Tax=Mycena metata TaxID=1033252 RepID=A0AAD7NJK6_9AGAR|nr:hypothetical protein B0H16DRAFT_1455402 [Mycena metata]
MSNSTFSQALEPVNASRRFEVTTRGLVIFLWGTWMCLSVFLLAFTFWPTDSGSPPPDLFKLGVLLCVPIACAGIIYGAWSIAGAYALGAARERSKSKSASTSYGACGHEHMRVLEDAGWAPVIAITDGRRYHARSKAPQVRTGSPLKTVLTIPTKTLVRELLNTQNDQGDRGNDDRAHKTVEIDGGSSGEIGGVILRSSSDCESKRKGKWKARGDDDVVRRYKVSLARELLRRQNEFRYWRIVYEWKRRRPDSMTTLNKKLRTWTRFIRFCGPLCAQDTANNPVVLAQRVKVLQIGRKKNHPLRKQAYDASDLRECRKSFGHGRRKYWIVKCEMSESWKGGELGEEIAWTPHDFEVRDVVEERMGEVEPSEIADSESVHGAEGREEVQVRHEGKCTGECRDASTDPEGFFHRKFIQLQCRRAQKEMPDRGRKKPRGLLCNFIQENTRRDGRNTTELASIRAYNEYAVQHGLDPGNIESL